MSTMNKRQLLRAVSCDITSETDLSKLSLPGYTSIKHDGIRIIVDDGVLYSRKRIRIPNRHLQSFDWSKWDGFEFEACVKVGGFTDTESVVMSEEKDPITAGLRLMIIESTRIEGDTAYDRHELIKAVYNRISRGNRADMYPIELIEVCEQTLVRTTDEIIAHYKAAIAAGHEGLIYKASHATYKRGTATLKGSELVRFKPFEDSEAVILNFIVGRTNTNPKEVDNVGLAKRSTRKEGMVEVDAISTIEVKDIKTGVVFRISSGITDALGKDMYRNPEKYRGQIVNYRYFAYGDYDKPRQASFVRFRHIDDVVL